MKALTWNLLITSTACLSFASFSATSTYGQAAADLRSTATPGSDGSQTGIVCANPPCKSAPSGKKSTAPHPGTIKQTEAELEQGRYSGLFGELAGLEQAAQRAESAGQTDIAASYRSYFAAKSGLTQEQADIVAKIGADYMQQGGVLQAKRIQTTLAVRHANPGVRMSRFNSPEIAEVEQEIADLLPTAKAKILAQIGPKAFTRLDSYMLHRNDNMKTLGPGAGSPPSKDEVK